MVTALLLGWSLAHAAEVPFTAPDEVRLFTAVATVTAKASAEDDACDEAARMALDELRDRAAKAGTPTLISAAIDGECKQAKTGSTVLTSVVSLDGVAVAEGPAMPVVTAQRALAIAATVGAPQGGLDAAAMVGLDGKAWLSLGPLDPGASEETAEARAATAFLDHVLPEAAKWGAVLPTLPELAGVAVEVLTDGKGKKRGALRFVVPTDEITTWRKGEIPDEVLLERAGAYVSPAGKERSWTPLKVDLTTAGQTDASLREVDMDDADLEGLEDESE